MPQIRVEIDGQVKTGPSENLSLLLQHYPQAKVLGPVTMGQRASDLAQAVLRSPALPIAGGIAAGALTGGLGAIPAAGLVALGSAGGEAARQIGQAGFGKIQPSAGAAAKQIAMQGASGAAGEGLGRMAGAGLRALGPEIQRVAPGLVDAIFGTGEKATERLFEKPQAVAQFAELGTKGINEANVEAVRMAKKALELELKGANAVYGKTKQIIMQKTKNEALIPTEGLIENLAQNANAHGLVPDLPSSDKLGLAQVRRFSESLAKLGENNGQKLKFSDYDLLRKQLNATIENPANSPSLKATLLEFKRQLDANAQIGLGEELGGRFADVLERQSKVRGLADELNPVLNARNAPAVVAKHVEEGTGIGQSLDELSKMSGQDFLSPVKSALAAVPFTRNVVKGMTHGASFAMGYKAPAGILSRIPYLGRAFSPYAVAQYAAMGARAPQAAVPMVRAGTQYAGSILGSPE